ncbi:MAG: hypothetical protein UH077_07875 [Bacteroidales bacterium]|nr:hypothetical protein [Bacteroidales bacterium]
MWGILIMLVVIAVVAFLFLKPNDSENEISDTSETIAQNTNNAQIEEVEQLVSESVPNKESIPVVKEYNSNNETRDNNGNKPTSVSEQKERSQATTETITHTKEVSSKINQKEEINPIGSIEEKALLVIRGNFGNGEERKAKLGAEYSAIQSKVNEMYANGLVH